MISFPPILPVVNVSNSFTIIEVADTPRRNVSIVRESSTRFDIFYTECVGRCDIIAHVERTMCCTMCVCIFLFSFFPFVEILSRAM